MQNTAKVAFNHIFHFQKIFNLQIWLILIPADITRGAVQWAPTALSSYTREHGRSTGRGPSSYVCLASPLTLGVGCKYLSVIVICLFCQTIFVMSRLIHYRVGAQPKLRSTAWSGLDQAGPPERVLVQKKKKERATDASRI